jgi:DNA-binding transcriptional MerR regulator
VTLSYTVGEVARLAHVTVRMLHHYDEIGLLVPGERSQAGYRVYSDADLERLQQILFYRELGFPLEEVGSILDAPGDDALDHLRRQRVALEDRIARLQAMVAAVQSAMEAREMGMSLTPEERFEVFGEWPLEEHEKEAAERWGETAAYQESARRTARYTKEDWLRIKANADALDEKLAALVRAGVDPSSQAAMDLAEEHRLQIHETFYDCSHEMHVGLGDMYVADARFNDRYEDLAPGLATFLHEAIRANAARQRRSGR